jgi:hypothetical protein
MAPSDGLTTAATALQANRHLRRAGRFIGGNTQLQGEFL